MMAFPAPAADEEGASRDPCPPRLSLLQRHLPAGVRLPELRAMLRNASSRGIAWEALLRRFGQADATVVLSALQAHQLLAPAEIDGWYERTAIATAWLARTQATDAGIEEVCDVLRGFVRRVDERRLRESAAFVPRRVIALPMLPLGEARFPLRVELYVELSLNEAAASAYRASAQNAARVATLGAAGAEAKWLSAERRALVRALEGGVPILRVTAGTSSVIGTEIYPRGADRWR